MYFSSRIEIDPRQVTVIKKINFTNLVDKIRIMFTNDKHAGKYEQETFTVLSILNEIEGALKSLKIDNVIRLSVDGYNLYDDNNSTEADLDWAIVSAKEKLDPINAEYFDNIFLVLEHVDEVLKYVIEIRIYRKHYVGEYPIQILVHGMVKELKCDKSDPNKIEEKLELLFSEEEDFNNYIDYRLLNFERFIIDLQIALGKFIRVDGIKKHITKKIIRPMSPIVSLEQIARNKSTYPIFNNYPNIEQYAYYCWKWSEYCHKFNVKVKDCVVVDDNGKRIAHIGKQGFKAQENNFFNVKLPFSVYPSPYIKYYLNNFYSQQIKGSNVEIEPSIEDLKNSYIDWVEEH